MTQHRHRGGRTGRLRSVRSSAALGAVGVIAGVLFATNAGIFAEATDRQPQDLADLVRDENQRMQQVAEQVSDLRTEVEDLISAREAYNPGAAADPGVEFAAGRTDLEGPGIEVQLWDAPYTEVPEGYSADDLVVHQQDIEGVLNGLRAGGAEAIAVQGHRVTSTTSVRCVGNVLLLDGNTYSPPYVITAIGDPQRLEQSVLDQHSVQVYLQYVDAVRLGFSAELSDDIHIPAVEGNLSLDYAQVPGHDPYRPDEAPAPFSGQEPE